MKAIKVLREVHSGDASSVALFLKLLEMEVRGRGLGNIIAVESRNLRYTEEGGSEVIWQTEVSVYGNYQARAAVVLFYADGHAEIIKSMDSTFHEVKNRYSNAIPWREACRAIAWFFSSRVKAQRPQIPQFK